MFSKYMLSMTVKNIIFIFLSISIPILVSLVMWFINHEDYISINKRIVLLKLNENMNLFDSCQFDIFI